MKKALALLITIVMLFTAAVPALAGAGAGAAAGSGGGPWRAGVIREGAQYRPGEILVKFKPGVGGGEAATARSRIGALSSERLSYADFELVKVPAALLERAIAALRSSGLVEYAEPNYVRTADLVPDDEFYGNQWNLKEAFAGGGIGMENAWDVTTGSAGVVVAVLDTGVAYRNGGGYLRAPDLANTSFVPGYDFVNDDPFADDDHGHGTHVAGTVAQSTNNTYGVAGVAFGCSVMPVKVLGSDRSGTDANIIRGIRFAADGGADVINMSLSGPDPNEALRDAIDYAFARGVVLCASSGNASTAFVDYPAAYPNCVAVGATGRNGSRASYSNYGSALDIMAPGGSTPLNPNGILQQTYIVEGNPSSGFGFVYKQGTSMASPHVAGVAALVKSVNPSWTASEVRGAVVMGARDLGTAGWDRHTGWGLLDAHAAVTQTKPGSDGPLLTSVTPAFADSGEGVSMITTGSRFANPVKLTLERIGEAGIGGTGLTQTGSTRIDCTLSLENAQPGLWDVVVEDKAMRSDTLHGGFAVDAADDRTWYLAEGSTDWGFEEYVQVQNPGGETATVELAFMTPYGPEPSYSMAVPPRSRATVRVNDVVPVTDVSVKVTSSHDIICERAMYWNNRIEGTDCIGVQAPSYAWYLAEGCTDYGFETFLTIQNPQSRAALVTVTYLTESGPVEKEPFVINRNSRYSVNVADDLPSSNMSFKVVSSERIICERSMYWDGRRGGHASNSSTSPAGGWYLAEGSTDWGFEEYVCIGNPGPGDASVALTYMTESGPVPAAPLNVPAGSRKTVKVNDALPGEDFSVRAVADSGVVVERAMYWNNGTGKAGHGALGVTQPRLQCFLPEGSTDWGFDEWLQIQNPNSTAASIGIEYMTSTQGMVPGPTFDLAAGSRATVHVNEQVPLMDVSTRVYSDLPVIAERSMYWNRRGGGHVSPGLMK